MSDLLSYAAINDNSSFSTQCNLEREYGKTVPVEDVADLVYFVAIDEKTNKDAADELEDVNQIMASVVSDLTEGCIENHALVAETHHTFLKLPYLEELFKEGIKHKEKTNDTVQSLLAFLNEALEDAKNKVESAESRMNAAIKEKEEVQAKALTETLGTDLAKKQADKIETLKKQLQEIALEKKYEYLKAKNAKERAYAKKTGREPIEKFPSFFVWAKTQA